MMFLRKAANFLGSDGRLVGERRADRQARRRFHIHRDTARRPETTLFSIITNLMHQGLIIVGLPYWFQGQMRLDEITGGAPYGATALAGGDGSRQVTANELAGARFLGPARGRGKQGAQARLSLRAARRMIEVDQSSTRR